MQGLYVLACKYHNMVCPHMLLRRHYRNSHQQYCILQPGFYNLGALRGTHHVWNIHHELRFVQSWLKDNHQQQHIHSYTWQAHRKMVPCTKVCTLVCRPGQVCILGLVCKQVGGKQVMAYKLELGGRQGLVCKFGGLVHGQLRGYTRLSDHVLMRHGW